MRKIEMVEVWPGEWRSAEEIRRKDRFLDSLGPVDRTPLPEVEYPHPNPFIGFAIFFGMICYACAATGVMIWFIEAVLG